MASSKVMPSTSNSTNSDLNSHHHHHHNHHHFHRNRSSSPSQMIPDFSNSDLQHRINEVYAPDNPPEAALLDAEIALIDAAGAISAIGSTAEEAAVVGRQQGSERKTVEEVWREIVSGKNERKECKVEAVDEMMTLEDFLAKAGAGMEEEEVAAVAGVEEEDVKVGVSEEMKMGSGGLFDFDHSLVQSSYLPPQQPGPIPVSMCGVMAYGNGGGGVGGGGMEVMGGVRGKRRGGPIMEPLDKAAQQRQRRMIKNRESAARSRERKQAYQVELESLAMKLEEENEQLLREKASSELGKW
ncbi:G-box-binding factor 4-like isoform X2 [Chenopodium quinoa]|uniref:G-box-binding factor 4-like isoform X2 n=1 Tax=Chenopodium quinoa TaxID=63459 RepID=UPI000B792CAA|nr:G-box-binding factor 4-like isoform X2 [Chenopodium quinoa]